MLVPCWPKSHGCPVAVLFFSDSHTNVCGSNPVPVHHSLPPVFHKHSSNQSALVKGKCSSEILFPTLWYWYLREHICPQHQSTLATAIGNKSTRNSCSHAVPIPSGSMPVIQRIYYQVYWIYMASFWRLGRGAIGVASSRRFSLPLYLT